MKRCSICHATYPATFTHCPHDGSLLIEANEWTDGAMIRGKYRILGRLGQGGMATVYKALHVGFDEVRALKVIQPELASDLSFVKRFGQEAALTRKLQHPNAVRVEDIDQADDGRPFMVMEFIEGESLKDVIQRQAPLPVPRVCRIAKQVAAALEAAHQLGMIHRDIKPANILLTRPPGSDEQAEVAKVLDFGIAKIREAHWAAGGTTLTRTGTSIGTPAYMSPEQAMGKTGEGLDGRADLYSLGVVMYEMLTGELPIKAESEVQMLIGQINTPPQPIRARRPELPEGIGAVVMRCLEKDPARRPASGAALIARIEACERGVAAGAATGEMPTVATPRPVPVETPGAVAARRPSRWAWAAALLALMVIATAIASGVWYFRSRRKPLAKEPVAARMAAKVQPSPQAAPISAPPPIAPEPPKVPSAPPSAGKASRKPAAEPGSNLDDQIQAALNGAPIDAASKAQVQDIWRQANRLMKKGDFDGAAAQYQRLAQLRPGWGPAIAALSGAIAAKGNLAASASQSRPANRSGDLGAAVARYTIAVGLHPDVAINHYALGAALGKLGDLDGDMREQQEALRLDPGMAQAHAELGHIHARRGAWSDAAGEYREAIRLKPHLAEAHSGLGDALGHSGDWQGEIAEERIAIQQAPGLAVAHFRLGLALEREGEAAGALEEYRRAAELEPGEAEFQANYQRLAGESRAH
ncbi:MAG TPA: serine/threonine-protein kinase [Bryobacteraceae bacterium]|nr:serine/threonine-protein kinase [Bryobacteraceae bacterium]